MENKSLLDREMILPLLLGGLSVIGIGAVFVFSRMSEARDVVPAADTATPFRFVYLGTEPGLSTLTPEATADHSENALSQAAWASGQLAAQALDQPDAW